jgi:hypothetical protein
MCSRVGQFWLLVAIGRGNLILDTFQPEGLATSRFGSHAADIPPRSGGIKRPAADTVLGRSERLLRAKRL